MDVVEFEFKFEGNDSDKHRIDFYDVNQAMIGFQRSLALTTHLVLNDKIITQAPALKGARIFALPAEESSWKMTASISLLATALYQAGTAPKDTPLGHIIYSMYDYVIMESLGVHVDYDKTLGQLYEDAHKQNIEVPRLSQARADALIEKCSTAVREMHRPISMNSTATRGLITARINQQDFPLPSPFSLETFEYINETYTSPEIEEIVGRISSYNSNSYKGRIFVPSEGRPISFELQPSARSHNNIVLITSSLSFSALERKSRNGFIRCKVLRQTSKSGQLKRYRILEIEEQR
ncbi:MAG: hypothetical protein PHH36_13315 [Sideroxydans sp.]|nr:hypothetical protein [Sideroxydans sp.]